MDRETFYQLMDKYLDGLLSNDENEDFEYLLKTDKNKLEEFENHKNIRRAVVIKSRQEKLTEINRLKNEYLNDQSKPAARRIRISRLVPYVIAASVFIIVGIIALMNNLPSKKVMVVHERELVDAEDSRSGNEMAYSPMKPDSQISKQESSKSYEREKEMYRAVKKSASYKVLYYSIFLMTGNEKFAISKFNKKEIGITIFYHPTLRKFELTDTGIAIYLNEDFEIKSFDLINIEKDQLEMMVNNKRVIVQN
jgi:hypothetical protein